MLGHINMRSIPIRLISFDLYYQLGRPIIQLFSSVVQASTVYQLLSDGPCNV